MRAYMKIEGFALTNVRQFIISFTLSCKYFTQLFIYRSSTNARIFIILTSFIFF